MKLSVIIPVHNGSENLRHCLATLAASTRPPDEVIVVDDASTDDSGDVARQAGAQVIRLDGSPHGPAYARNRGAEIAQGDVLVFLDADVAVHLDTLARIEQYLVEQPDVAALFGSYDANPPARNFAARYKNLMHHYVHQHGRREASTFWTGCGAIRRDVFASLGGFDESYRMIEDIELGVRLRRAGRRVWLCADVQVTHLKRWTFAGLLRSDIFDRAVPWTRLILQDRHLPADLNVNVRGRLGAVAAWGLVVCLVLGCWRPVFWTGALLALSALIGLNADLYLFFVRRGGIRFAAGAAGLHTLYLVYSSLVFVAMLAGHVLFRDRPRRALLLLLLVTFLKGWLWSIVVPVWQAHDEDQHFGYAQEVTRQRTWAVNPPSQVTEERVVLWRIFFDLWGEGGSLAALTLDEQQEMTGLVQYLQSPAVRMNLAPPPWFPTFVRQHPPLYYTLQALVHDLAAEQNILVRMAWMRLLSVVMGVGAVACAYGAAREMWPDRPGWPLTAATLVSFQPMFTFFTSAVNNAALEMLCFAALTWLAVIVARRGLSWRRGLALSGVLAAGLLTKSSFLAAIPLVALLWGWDVWRQRGRCHWGGWAAAAILPLVLAGWWYVGFVARGSGKMAEVYFASPRPIQPVSLLDYLWHYPWLTRYRPFAQFWWGLFGWGGVSYPKWLYAALNILTGLAFLGWPWQVWCGLRVRRIEPGDTLAVTLGVGFTLTLIAFYTALGYLMAGYGSVFKVQARYFVAPVTAQLLALTVGWTAIRRARRWTLPVLVVGMIGLNLYALFNVIAPRYYGPGDLLTLLERATVLQPVNLVVLLMLCVGFAALTLALLAALIADLNARTFAQDELI